MTGTRIEASYLIIIIGFVITIVRSIIVFFMADEARTIIFFRYCLSHCHFKTSIIIY